MNTKRILTAITYIVTTIANCISSMIFLDLTWNIPFPVGINIGLIASLGLVSGQWLWSLINMRLNVYRPRLKRAVSLNNTRAKA